MSGLGIGLPTGAVLQLNYGTNPTAPASTSAFKMQGLGAIFVPVLSGQALVEISAVAVDSATTVGAGIALQAYIGLLQAGVAPPANAAAIPANASPIGQVVKWASGVTLTTAADLFQPIECGGIVTALVINQQYWIDVAAESIVAASDVSLTLPQVTAFEIA